MQDNDSLEKRNLEHYGITGAGFDLSNIEETTREEIDDYLRVWIPMTRDRGINYGLNALTLLTEERPDIAKLAWLGAGGIPEELLNHPSRLIMQNVRNLVEYIRLGWESGIYNEFRELQMRGMTKAGIFELVMYANLSGGGIRGMGHTYNATSRALFDWADGTNPSYPEGWSADAEAFKCGLDMSTSHMTDQDKKNMVDWYEKTMNWVPKSVRFGIKHNPRFLKTQRMKWEHVFKTLPKQFAPFLMLAQHTSTGFREGLREGALLAKAWGVSKEWVLEPICGQAYYFRGHEALELAHDAIDDILDNWDK